MKSTFVSCFLFLLLVPLNARSLSFDRAMDAPVSSAPVPSFESFSLQLSAPRNLMAIAGNSQVTLVWNKNIDTTYLVYRIYGGPLANPITIIDSTSGWFEDTVRVVTGLENGTTYYFRITASAAGMLESEFSNEVSAIPLPSPVIASFLPPSGRVGSIVTISGAHFNSNASSNIVYFGTVRAVVNACTADSINVTVPRGATSAPITIVDTSRRFSVVSIHSFQVTYPSSRTITPTSFVSTAPTGQVLVFGMTTGDIDGDGKTDVVLANNSINSGYVYRNTSTIEALALAPPVVLKTFTLDQPGGGPLDTEVGDLDSDGKNDIVFANTSAHSISVFRNVSTPGTIDTSSFEARMDIWADYPHIVKIADMDGDGWLDIIALNWANVSIFRNRGVRHSISLCPEFRVPTSGNAATLNLSDVDGDGRLDILVGIGMSPNMQVARNSGSAGVMSFEPVVYVQVGMNPFDAVTGDLDYDGKDDLLVSHDTDGRIAILRNASTVGSVSFVPYQSPAFLPSGYYPNMVLEDLDGDYRLDLVVANGNTPGAFLSIFQNKSSLNPTDSLIFLRAVEKGGLLSQYAISAADMEGDGRPDLITVGSLLHNLVPFIFPPQSLSATNISEGVFLKWRKNSETHFLRYRIYGGTLPGSKLQIDSTTNGATDTSKIIPGLIPRQTYYFRVTAVDSLGHESEYSNEVMSIPPVLSVTPRANTTGVSATSTIVVEFGVDVESTTLNNSTVKVFGSQSGSHQALFNYVPATRTAVLTPEIPFLSGEEVTVRLTRGILDVNADSLSRSYVWKFIIASKRALGRFTRLSTFSSGTGLRHIVTADMDKDRKVDIAALNPSIAILGNKGYGSFVEISSLIVAFHTPTQFIAFDLDGEGPADLAVADLYTYGISAMKNNGFGTFSWTSVNQVGNMTSVVAGYLDEDAAVDLAGGDYYADRVPILRNNGLGGFARSSILFPGGATSCMAADDFDNDGLIDLTIAGRTSISVFKGSWKNDFTWFSSYQGVELPSSVALIDFNGDGFTDLAIANLGTNNISLLRNNGSGVFSYDGAIPVGAGAQSMLTGDWNGDGATDLAIASADSNTIKIFLNDGVGAFVQQSVIQTSGSPVSLATADFDGDNALDLSVALVDSNAISVFRNRFPVKITTSRDSLFFGEVATGDRKTISLVVSNDGLDSTLTILDVSPTGLYFSVERKSFSIGPGATDSVLITFSPTVYGSFDDALVIVSDDPNQQYIQIPIFGFSPSSNISALPQAISFGSHAKGFVGSDTLRVTNSSITTLILDSIYTTTTQFIVETAEGSVRQADTLLLLVKFLPSAFGSYHDTLYLHNNSPTPLVKIPMTGNSPPPSISTTLSSLAFGDVAKNSTESQSFFVMNGSINSLLIDSIYTLTSQFVSDSAGGAVDDSDSLRLTVRFTPNTFGAFNDTLYMSNNSLTPNFKIPMSGNSPFTLININPTSLVFGELPKDSTKTLSVSVTNGSINVLVIDSIYTGTTRFTVDSIHASVTQTDTLHLTVRFTPDTFGLFSDTLYLHNNSLTPLVKLPLIGNSPSSLIALSSSILIFPDATKDSTKVMSLSVANGSVNTLIIDSIYTKTGQFMADSAHGTVGQADTLEIMVYFRPDAIGRFSDTLYIHNNSTVPLAKIPLQGNSPAPILEASTFSLTLGPVALTDTAHRFLRLFNNGSVNKLTITSMTYVAPLFMIDHAAPFTISPDDSVTLSIDFNVERFTPQGYGTHYDTLRVASDGGNLKIALTGLSPLPKSIASPLQIDFGEVLRDSAQIGITDSSVNVLRIDSIVTHTKYFSVSSATYPIYLSSLDTLRSWVFFRPDTIREYRDTILVHDNSQWGIVSLKIPLVGRGSPLTSVEAEQLIPEVYSLAQNYPNPFNPSTTLRYGLPFRSHVKLSIFNLLGQRIAELVDEEVDAGYYQKQWNAGVASGLYFYRLEAVSVSDPGIRLVDVKKMILLK